MTERSISEDPGNKPKKKFTDKLLEHTELFSKLASYTASDVKIGLKIAYEKTKDTATALKNPKKIKEKSFNALPDTIKNDLSQNGIRAVAVNEKKIFERTNSILSDSIDLSDERARIILFPDEADEDADYAEPDNKIYKIGIDLDDIDAFMGGVYMGHYIARKNQANNSLPEFSEERIHRYNNDIRREAEDHEIDIYTYLAHKGKDLVQDKTLTDQLDNLMIVVPHRKNQMVRGGAIYMMGLSESQREIDALNKSFKSPHFGS